MTHRLACTLYAHYTQLARSSSTCSARGLHTHTLHNGQPDHPAANLFRPPRDTHGEGWETWCSHTQSGSSVGEEATAPLEARCTSRRRTGRGLHADPAGPWVRARGVHRAAS